jgi:hypothetical protein
MNDGNVKENDDGTMEMSFNMEDGEMGSHDEL